MTKALKLFSLLFLFLVSTVSADTEAEEDMLFVNQRYRLTVTKVDPEFHCFSLTNKLVCNIPKKNWETDALPEVVDEIFIMPFPRVHDHRSSHVETGELLVGIRDPQTKLLAKKPITVWISDESEYQLWFVRSEWHVTEPASGWLSPAVYTEFMVLSDGYRWVRKQEKATVFEPGDRIIVGKVSEEKYLLIDLDTISPITTNGVGKGKKLIQLAHEKVDPLYTQKVTKE